MSTKNHPNSKKVWLRRTDTYLDAVQTQAKEFMSMSRKSVGSFWESPTSRAVGTGLDFHEQRILLPEIVNCEADDKDFRRSVVKYYKDIRTVVPFGDGIELEIGLLIDNDKPVTYKDKEGLQNVPIKFSDYIRYRHARAHPLCAVDFASSKGDQRILFYIYDADVEERLTAQKDNQRDDAMVNYLSMKDNARKVTDMLLLLGVDPRDFSGPNAEVLRINKLREIVDKSPAEFNKIYKVDNFELRSKIEGFIKTGIFRKVGERIIDASDNKVIGNNLKDTIDMLMGDNPEFKEKMTLWMGSYQEAMNKPTMAKRGTKKVTA